MPADYKAKGLKQVEEKLKYEQINIVEKQAYDTHFKNVKISKSLIESGKYASREDCKEEGFGKFILRGFDNNHPISLVSNITESSEKEIIRILKQNGIMM